MYEICTRLPSKERSSDLKRIAELASLQVDFLAAIAKKVPPAEFHARGQEGQGACMSSTLEHPSRRGLFSFLSLSFARHSRLSLSLLPPPSTTPSLATVCPCSHRPFITRPSPCRPLRPSPIPLPSSAQLALLVRLLTQGGIAFLRSSTFPTVLPSLESSSSANWSSDLSSTARPPPRKVSSFLLPQRYC